MAIWDNLGGLGGTAISWAASTAFWILVMILIVFAFFGILFIRKRNKFNKVILEMIDLGQGRFDFRTTKGGWFKARSTLFGLYDYGSEERFKLKDKTIIDNVSHNDYRNINGKLGVIVIRNPHDPKIAFPISRFYISKNSRAIMSEVAPADYRDAAEKSIEQVDNEMKTKWEQYAPMVIIGVVIVISLVITLLNTQYGKYMVDKAIETIRIIKETPCASIPSTTAP